MTKSHVAGWGQYAPTPAQLKEFFSQIDSGQLTKERLQRMLNQPNHLKNARKVDVSVKGINPSEYFKEFHADWESKDDNLYRPDFFRDLTEKWAPGRVLEENDFKAELKYIDIKKDTDEVQLAAAMPDDYGFYDLGDSFFGVLVSLLGSDYTGSGALVKDDKCSNYFHALISSDRLHSWNDLITVRVLWYGHSNRWGIVAYHFGNTSLKKGDRFFFLKQPQ